MGGKGVERNTTPSLFLNFSNFLLQKPKKDYSVKKIFRITILLSQIFLSQSCFLRSLDKGMIFNTSIHSTNDVYKHSGDNHYNSYDYRLNFEPGASSDSIMRAYDFYSAPTFDPLDPGH